MAVVRSAPVGPSIVDHLDDALADTVRLLDGLPAGSFADRTPCPGWLVRDVVAHLAAVTEKFGRFAAGDVPADGPLRQRAADLPGDDPAGGFRAVAEAARHAWRTHPEALARACVLPFGAFDGATAAGINLFDALVHTWDIAAGAGVPYAMRDDLAVAALAVAPLLVTEDAVASGQFARPAPPPEGRLEAPVAPGVALLSAAGRRVDD